MTRFVALLVLLTGGPTVWFARPAAAQELRTTTEENFRATPNGVLIGVVRPGVPLTLVQERDPWIEAEIEGWVWIRSLQVTERDDLDLVVSEDQGENMRSEPSGRVIARLPSGALLEEIERIPGWVRVRRRGWIWAESVARVTPEEADAPDAPGEGDADETENPSSVVGTGAAGASILSGPGGDTLARTAPGAELQVLARDGDWARVRVDGWVWLPASDTGAVALVSEATPLDVGREPDAHRGRVVTWTLQYISLERAERVRSDFYEGEPFLLTRSSAGDGPFVYVAVPSELMDRVGALSPLETITVVGRVRTGASRLTGSPVLDLLELRRGSDPAGDRP